MQSSIINNIDQQTIPLLKYNPVINVLAPITIIDENLRRIMEETIMLEWKKNKINLSINRAPKKIVKNNEISIHLKEVPEISSDINTQVNISLKDETSLKHYEKSGIEI